MGVLRTWHCLNARCALEFTAWEANPECPSCKCVRVSWVPAGGHITSGSTRMADRDISDLAGTFGLTNLNSSDRTKGAKPVAPGTLQSADRNSQPIQFAPGFAAPVDRYHAACVPSTQGVNFKASLQPGTPLARNRAVPPISGNTRIEGRHKASA